MIIHWWLMFVNRQALLDNFGQYLKILDNIGQHWQALYIADKDERQTHLTRLSRGCPSYDFQRTRGHAGVNFFFPKHWYMSFIHPCFYPSVSIRTPPLLTLLVVLTPVQPGERDMFQVRDIFQVLDGRWFWLFLDPHLPGSSFPQLSATPF